MYYEKYCRSDIYVFMLLNLKNDFLVKKNNLLCFTGLTDFEGLYLQITVVVVFIVYVNIVFLQFQRNTNAQIQVVFR